MSAVKKTEPKKRAPRAKKQPSKEEVMKQVLDEINKIKQSMQDLKEDEMKLSSMQLKLVPTLIKEALEDYTEDLKEVETQYEELKNMPNEPNK
jgi:predicted metal-dependent hydrolase